jgi:hypothetical protein
MKTSRRRSEAQQRGSARRMLALFFKQQDMIYRKYLRHLNAPAQFKGYINLREIFSAPSFEVSFRNDWSLCYSASEIGLVFRLKHRNSCLDILLYYNFLLLAKLYLFAVIYRFSSNVPFLELDYPLSGAKCRYRQLHSLSNQAPKKVILYEKQYMYRF